MSDSSTYIPPKVWKWENQSGKSEFGNQKYEIGGGKSEVGNRKLESGKGKLEVGK